MRSRTLRYFLVAAVTVAGVGGIFAARSVIAAETTVSALAKETHFHGIAVDPSEPSRVYLATHHGLYSLAADGSAIQISASRDDFMGFTPHPLDPAILYASGHPAGGGRTWSKVGLAPEGLIDIAASGQDAGMLYAATRNGLFKSIDAGRSWQAAQVIKGLATMVQVTGRGQVYAFIFGTGLLRADDGGVNWRLVNNDSGGAYVLHLAVDQKEGRRIYAVTLDSETRAQGVLESGDGGETWAPLAAD